jgi:hypothetical protein
MNDTIALFLILVLCFLLYYDIYDIHFNNEKATAAPSNSISQSSQSSQSTSQPNPPNNPYADCSDCETIQAPGGGWVALNPYIMPLSDSSCSFTYTDPNIPALDVQSLNTPDHVIQTS